MTHPDTRRPAETPPGGPLRHRVLGLLDFASTLVLAMVDAMLAHTNHTPVPSRHDDTDRSPRGRSSAPSRLR